MAAEAHLDRCPKCARMFRWEKEAKRALKRRLHLLSAKPALRRRVLDQIGTSSGVTAYGLPYLRHDLAVGFAVLLLLAIPYLGWWGRSEPDLFNDAIAHYRKLTQGVVEAQAGAPPTPPAARVLDLSPWGYRMLARHSQELRGYRGQAFVYRGEQNEYLLAQEFEGAKFFPPRGAKALHVAHRDFVSYSQAGVNLVAWKEKDLVCMIASSLPRERLLKLARQITARG